MDFDAASKLADAGGRAKSDVANKLASMALHRVSQHVAAPTAVRSEAYQRAVRDTFGNRCPYCRLPLDSSSIVLEHLDAMNQFRAGLHVPGNVLPACRRCNLEKRRDDQAADLPVGTSGWEQFLCHDGSHGSACKTCAYWADRWPDPAARAQALSQSLQLITAFRAQQLPLAAMQLATILAPRLQALYVAAQRFAEESTEELVRTCLSPE